MNRPQTNPRKPLSPKAKHSRPLSPRIFDLEEEREERDPNAKALWKAGTLLNPVPPILVSCGGTNGFAPNLITLAWAGTICSEPPMLSISIRPERHSYKIIKETGEFVVNLTTAKLARATDWCGVKSGRDVDKFKEMHLTPAPARTVGCPILAESPVNLECKVTKVIPLGSHDLFLAEIKAVQVTRDLINKNSKLCLERANLLAYSHGEYWTLGKRLGGFGFSVRKK